MAKKSLLDDIIGKVQSKFVKQPSKKAVSLEEGEVDYLWMTEDHSQMNEKPVVKREPRIATEILKDRIKEKLAKQNSNPD